VKKGNQFMKWSLLFALVLMMLPVSYAGDVSGIWKGSIDSPMGPLANTITLQVDGEKVDGFVKADMFEGKIEKGALNGDKISFIINMEYGMLEYEGTITGDEMNLSVTGPDGNPLQLKATRQK
jgi:hypothetical protein